ncbi:MAG TPA: hypothetical protein VFL60_08035 [Gaiellaceae bacterium]|nr:hypothetical protein [Gaiellaceae bacterium]
MQLPAANVEEIRGFLERQSRVKAAAWARHEEPGPDGSQAPDHHILLAVDDEDWATGDIVALEQGIELPALRIAGPTWLDFFPLSELGEARRFATLLWEQRAPGADPLDYRFTYEPFAAEPDSLVRLAALLDGEPTVRSVGATVQRLWKGDRLVEETVRLFVDAGTPPNDVLRIVGDAARETVLAGRSSHGATLGPPRGEATAILYEAAA